jgi:hypothetical protein
MRLTKLSQGISNEGRRSAVTRHRFPGGFTAMQDKGSIILISARPGPLNPQTEEGKVQGNTPL